MPLRVLRAMARPAIFCGSAAWDQIGFGRQGRAMTTPLTNSIGATNFNPAALGVGRFVADGERWSGGLGTAVALTFSFPGPFSIWTQPYGSVNEPFFGNFVPLT